MSGNAGSATIYLINLKRVNALGKRGPRVRRGCLAQAAGVGAAFITFHMIEF